MLNFFLGEAVFLKGLNVSWTDFTSLEWYWYFCHHESFIVSFLFSLKPEPLPLIMVQERTRLVQFFRALMTQWCQSDFTNRPVRLTQCCTQFKSPGVKILCVLYLHYNVAFTFKWYGNSWNKTFYPQRVRIGYNI